jgi:hypothetical protein
MTTRPQGHYHVDVFRADGAFVRGLTLQQVQEGAPHYRIVDDAGVISPPGTVLSEPLPLEEALRQALMETRKHLHVPITPVYGSAPYELLGYERPRLFRTGQEVGQDGRPREGVRFRWKRRIARGQLNVDLEEDGIGIYGWPKGALWASFPLSRRARRALTDPGAEKPLAFVRARSPGWLRDLTFAFDLLFRLLEAAPGGSKVERVRFENPSAGAIFVPSDLAPAAGDLPTACAEAAVGNKVDKGTLIVNDRALQFRCDCLSHVDLWMALPDGAAWLTRVALQEIAKATAERHGVVIAP